MKERKNEALEFLLERYKKRLDLQDVFPEVKVGDYQALINWAAEVSSKRIDDSDTELLSSYKTWFQENAKPLERPKNEDTISEILKFSQNPYDNTLKELLKESDINDHLSTLFFITKEFNLRKTLELGVRTGVSTTALVEAASSINGHLWSIDINECKFANEKISSMGLKKYWSFIQGNDLEVAKGWKQEIDHIFIDSLHSYSHCLKELQSFEKFLTPNGFITFHDTRTYPGILKAILEFLKNCKNKFRFYCYFNSNGFVILRRTS